MARTVYCRWCYNKGHNRRTCPEYTERLKERAESEVRANVDRDDDNQGTYSQRDYADRIKADKLLDGTPHDREKQGSGIGTRRCSYCAQTGHNRRTCALFVERKQEYLSDVVIYRKDIAKTIEKAGLGIGSLVTMQPRHERDQDDSRNHLYLVTEVNWTDVNHASQTRVLRAQALDLKEDGSPEQCHYIPLPKPHNHKDDPDKQDWQQQYASIEEFYERVEIVGTVTANSIKQSIPADWYNAKVVEKSDYFKAYFKDARSPCYWDSFYNDD
jgi:hypothetical protein